MLSRRNLAYPSHRSSLNSRPVNLLQPLCSLFMTPILCFQRLAASFSKTPGVGGTSRLRSNLEHPTSNLCFCPSPAPRGVSIPCALTRLRILPVTTGVWRPPALLATRHFPLARRSDIQTFKLSNALLPALCFHTLTNCSSRKSFLLITIRIALGCTPPTSETATSRGGLEQNGRNWSNWREKMGTGSIVQPGCTKPRNYQRRDLRERSNGISPAKKLSPGRFSISKSIRANCPWSRKPSKLLA